LRQFGKMPLAALDLGILAITEIVGEQAAFVSTTK
jgi:hypothetical protein